MSGMARVPIHLDIHRALDMIGDEAGVREIVQMAATGLRRDMPRIRELLQTGDVVAANGILHAIKGMLPVFCTDQLTEQVNVCEQLGKSASLQDYLPAYDAVEPQLEQLRDEIEAHLKNAPSPEIK